MRAVIPRMCGCSFEINATGPSDWFVLVVVHFMIAYPFTDTAVVLLLHLDDSVNVTFTPIFQ